jgi:putative copper resistance protein D
MPALYYVNVTTHVLAAMLWLGGMFFLGVVGAPLVRAIQPPELRQRLFQLIGERFRAVGWVAITVLLCTGIGNLYFRGWLHWHGVLDSPAFWRTHTGEALAAKLSAVAIMISVQGVHDFIDGPRAGRAVPGSPESLRLRRRAALLARVNAVVGVILVVAAVRLARGG